MNRLLVGTVLLLLTATTTHAQQRRAAGGGGAPAEPREIIRPMARFPYVGTWVGQMKANGDGMPLSVEIRVMNGKYNSVSYGPMGGQINHLKTELADGALRWEIKNSGDGIWIYEASRMVGDTIFGSVKLEGMLGRDGNPVNGTLLLVRQRP